MKALVALLMVVPLVAIAGPTKKARIVGLKAKARSVRAERAALQKKLGQARRTAIYTKQNLAVLDGRLNRTEAKVRDTEAALAVRTAEQIRLADRVKSTRKTLAVTSVQVRRRLRAMYLQGESPALSLVLGVRSLEDVALRKDLMERIAESDKRLFDRYAALQRSAIADKRKQDRVVAETRTLAAERRRVQESLVDAKLDKRAMLADLAKKQADLRRAIAAYDEDEARIANEIAAYTARVAAAPATALPRYGGGRFVRPNFGRVTSPFGVRIHPVLRTRRMHTGTDFAGGYGSPVVAAASGRVVSCGWGGAYGNRIILDHGGGLFTMYGHLSRTYVGGGAIVRRGQPIGAIGSTGLSTGPHLHFEVWRGSRKVNPMAYL